ncbi:MAG TPA: PRC-barrel domain-containing protein [Aestuariivirga sp.]|nr:PRC-barrel domain-containing protein [Aestuariivirga sp.]
MSSTKILFAAVLFIGLSGSETWADCNISDSKIEEAILQKPELRDPVNRQLVRDLRSLRDSAFVLWSYGRIEDCERLMGNIRELVASPSMASLGGSDEDEADLQDAAREPLVRRGGNSLGRRSDPNATPLIRIDEMAPGLRADEIIGAEVRTADDKVVGEVRNIVFGTKDRQDYAIVASGGFFVPGKDSIVVPIRFLRVSQERETFYLPITEAQVKSVPLMPDREYDWLSDETWRTQNDALFASAPKANQ